MQSLARPAFEAASQVSLSKTEVSETPVTIRRETRAHVAVVTGYLDQEASSEGLTKFVSSPPHLDFAAHPLSSPRLQEGLDTLRRVVTTEPTPSRACGLSRRPFRRRPAKGDAFPSTGCFGPSRNGCGSGRGSLPGSFARALPLVTPPPSGTLLSREPAPLCPLGIAPV